MAAKHNRRESARLFGEAKTGTAMQMSRKSPLEDPQVAAHAWARYRRLMRFMMGLTLGTVLLAVALIYRNAEHVSPHFLIATALGIGFSMLLTSALMGLVFLSNGTGHDSAVDRFPEEDSEES